MAKRRVVNTGASSTLPSPVDSGIEDSTAIIGGTAANRFADLEQGLASDNGLLHGSSKDMALDQFSLAEAVNTLPQDFAAKFPRLAKQLALPGATPQPSVTVGGQTFTGDTSGDVAQKAIAANRAADPRAVAPTPQEQVDRFGALAAATPFASSLQKANRLKTPAQKERDFRSVILKVRNGETTDTQEDAETFFGVDGLDASVDTRKTDSNGKVRTEFTRNRDFFGYYDDEVKSYRDNLADALAAHGNQPFRDMDEYSEFIQKVEGYSPAIKEGAKRLATRFMPQNLRQIQADKEKQDRLNALGEGEFSVVDGQVIPKKPDPRAEITKALEDEKYQIAERERIGLPPIVSKSDKDQTKLNEAVQVQAQSDLDDATIALQNVQGGFKIPLLGDRPILPGDKRYGSFFDDNDKPLPDARFLDEATAKTLVKNAQKNSLRKVTVSTPSGDVERTKLNDLDEGAFKEWYDGWATATGINPNPDDPNGQYDYRGIFATGGEPIEAADGSYTWPEEFKDQTTVAAPGVGAVQEAEVVAPSADPLDFPSLESAESANLPVGTKLLIGPEKRPATVR